MSSQRSPQLSKTRFIAGLQCLKRLYPECYQRDLADPVEPSQQAIFDTGTAVGEMARQRFPFGRLIEEPYFEHTQALKSTQVLLADTSIPALYEAAFAFESTRTRVDILRNTGQQGFELVEVKSSTSAKPEHIPDAAIQLHVLEGSGIHVTRAFLMHINTAYVYQGGQHDLEQLFSLQDITDDVRGFVSDSIPANLAQMWEILELGKAPEVETGPHCTTPYQCPFYGNCHLKESGHPVGELPRLSQKILGDLKESGIGDVSSIPEDFVGLTPRQQRVRDSVVSKQPFVSADLASRLKEIIFPASFLDFETFNPAIPAYIGTRPYQIIPFQWSLHVRDSSDLLSHESFLNDDAEDPRERFITSLLSAIPTEGKIIVYSGYEQTVMKQLIDSFPEYADRLQELCDRTFDLLKLIRECYYHPDFHGSYSIKAVLPALVPGLSYADLGIHDGSTAALSYALMIANDTPSSDKVTTEENLLAYCQRDTEAMVRIFEVLLAESSGY